MSFGEADGSSVPWSRWLLNGHLTIPTHSCEGWKDRKLRSISLQLPMKYANPCSHRSAEQLSSRKETPAEPVTSVMPGVTWLESLHRSSVGAQIVGKKICISKLPCWNLPPSDFPPLAFPVITEDTLSLQFADTPSILTSSRHPPGWRGSGSPRAPPRRHTHMKMHGRQALGPDRWVETTLHFVTMTASYFCTSAVLQNISDFLKNPGTFLHKDFFWRS